MNLKTVTARTMHEALGEVRRLLGANAVILHTRSYKHGGILGVGARTYVEVTAADGRELGRKQRKTQDDRRRELLAEARRAQQRRSPAKPMEADPWASTASQPARPELAGDLIRRTYAAARADVSTPKPTDANPWTLASTDADPTPHPVRVREAQHVSAPGNESPPAVAPNQQSEASNQQSPALFDPRQITDEMRAIKRMVARMSQDRRQRTTGDTAARSDMPDKLFDQYLSLLEQEVAEELAGEIVDNVRQSLEQSELEDAHACRRAVMKAVAQLMPTDDPESDAAAATPAVKRGPRTIALIGPTGVGKTTTIAKLAATFKLKRQLKVALITIDTYRIAAVDQLRTYAGIIGVPLRVVTSPDEMQRAVQEFADCDAVLIDTAGRSQRDDPRLDELARFIKAADADEVHLVLSSTCTQSVLEDTIERFARIPADRVIFTKLDEAVTFGVVLNVMRKVRKRLSYVTTGQEVPHEIEPGRADRLAALMLGEGVLKS
ncbi:MAG: flagellar biosynthesis protein FlhF [Phycisphaeraceae bacterium]